MSSSSVVELDVRPLLARQQAPLPAILEAVGALQAGQSLRLIAPFEPVPLYDLLRARGYTSRAEQRPDGAWEVRFEPA